MHSSPFQAGFDHDFIATFHGPTANRQTLLTIKGILHVVFSFFQIGQVLLKDFDLCVRLV